MKAKAGRITLKAVLRNELKDAGFAFFFKKEKAISDIARLIRSARQHACLTQAELAKRANTSQSVIARMESGMDRRIPSLDLMDRIAHALKARLLISLDYKAAA